jgi:hypothetical protein
MRHDIPSWTNSGVIFFILACLVALVCIAIIIARYFSNPKCADCGKRIASAGLYHILYLNIKNESYTVPICRPCLIVRGGKVVAPLA